MRKLTLVKVFSLSFLFILVYIFLLLFYEISKTKTENLGVLFKRNESVVKNTRIVLSLVACDSRYNETLNVVKSALMFSKSLLHFVIITDDKIKFYDTLDKWRTLTKEQLDFELHDINFPDPHKDIWINLFKKCAAQRLFLPKLLNHIDSVIYLDTDTLLMGPVDELWHFFSKFNDSQISAMTLEDENPNVSWYPRFAKHPFYGKNGLNSGVMLMNLTRMRSFDWEQYVTPIMLRWKLDIPWGDQDIINIIFHYHPGAVLELPCRYNYRPDQCMYGDACLAASQDGILVLHGNRQVFHNNEQPAFRAIYQAINQFSVGEELSESFIINLKRILTESPSSNCINLRDTFLKAPLKVLNSTYEFSKQIQKL